MITYFYLCLWAQFAAIVLTIILGYALIYGCILLNEQIEIYRKQKSRNVLDEYWKNK